MGNELTERERTVLQYVVQEFIENATPVGSRYISRKHEDVLGLSSASIRNVMSDLEYLGYIDHPHTSAGRVPTDRGYRMYLDSLMKKQELTREEQAQIRRNLDSAEEMDEMLRESSRLLGSISRQLCIVTAPRISSGTFEKMELVPITGNRIMVIMSIKSGLVQTIMMEVATEVSREQLDGLARFINERLVGLSLRELRETFAERVKDAADCDTGLIRLFIDSVDKLFVPHRPEKLHIAGTDKIIEQPEFEDPKNFRGVIELINDEEAIIHVLERTEGSPHQVRVTIGRENKDEKLQQYSVITTPYTVGDVTGTIGVIGPRRMQYARMLPLVDYVAHVLSEMFTTSNRV